MKTLVVLGDPSLILGFISILLSILFWMNPRLPESQPKKKMGLIIFALIAGIVLIVIGIVMDDFVVMPYVVHKNLSDATNILQGFGLKVEVSNATDMLYDNSKVTFQSIEMDDVIKKGTLVKIEIGPTATSSLTPYENTSTQDSSSAHAKTEPGPTPKPTKNTSLATTFVPPPEPTPKRSLAPTPNITKSIKSGDKLKVVNCKIDFSLRIKPDGNYIDGRKSIKPSTVVTFMSTAENGFYIVRYANKDWFALAAYLAPINSEVFKKNASSPISDREFNQNDLAVNGITIGSSSIQDVRKQYGEPVIPDEAGRIWRYDDLSFSFRNSKVVGIEIYGLNAAGPRGIKVGMNLAEALNTFKMDVSILEDSRTHDLILYSKEKKRIDPNVRYAVIHNDGDGGNGIIDFFDDIKNAHMKITIQNSFVRRISIYVD